MRVLCVDTPSSALPGPPMQLARVLLPALHRITLDPAQPMEQKTQALAILHDVLRHLGIMAGAQQKMVRCPCSMPHHMLCVRLAAVSLPTA